MRFLASLVAVLGLTFVGCEGDLDRPTNEPKVNVNTSRTPDLNPSTDDDIDIKTPDVDVDVKNRPDRALPDVDVDATQPADRDTDANENVPPTP